jgi:hypothetical protein
MHHAVHVLAASARTGALFGVVGVAVAAVAVREAMRSGGVEVLARHGLTEPVVRVREPVMPAIAAAGETPRFRVRTERLTGDDPAKLREILGPVRLLDFNAMSWALRYHPDDSDGFAALYLVRGRLLISPARRSCGKGPASWTSIPGRHSLAEAEQRLLGAGGLVEGRERFEARFDGLALGATDVAAVRALMERAFDAPAGSEIELRGTLEGRPFRAEAEKSRAGRVKFKLRGYRFDDAGQAEAFIAPFTGRGVRGVELEALVAGQPAKIKREPAAVTGSAAEPGR